MPRNSTGVYTAPAGTAAVTNQLISSTAYNAYVNDVSLALSQSLATTGVTQMVGNLNMGGFAITGVGTFNATNLQASNVYPTFGVQPNFVLNASSTQAQLKWDGPDGILFQYGSHTTQFYANSTVVASIDGNGYLSINGGITCANVSTFNNTVTVNGILNAGTGYINNLHTSGTIYGGDFNGGNVLANSVYPYASGSGNNYVLYGNSSQRILQWSGNWYIYWATSGGATWWVNNGANAMSLDGPGNLVVYNGQCYKPSGGPWAATSDERTKKDIASYESGLDEVRRLRPISFKYNGLGGTPNDGKTYHGLIAQATAPIMPELVHEIPRAVEAEDEIKAGGRQELLEGQLGTDLGPLLLALVNAVRQLADRVEALEANLAP